jgi:hypothetical protein
LDVEEHEVVWPAVHAAIGQPGGRLGIVGRIMHARLQASGEQLRRRADEHGAQCGQPVLGDAERRQDKVLEKVRVEASTDGVVVDDEHAVEGGGQLGAVDAGELFLRRHGGRGHCAWPHL